MRRIAQAPSHYEVELRQADRQGERTGTGWRAIRRVQPDGTMQPLRFGTLQAAQAHAGRLGGPGGAGRSGGAGRLAPGGGSGRDVNDRVRSRVAPCRLHP